MAATAASVALLCTSLFIDELRSIALPMLGVVVLSGLCIAAWLTR